MEGSVYDTPKQVQSKSCVFLVSLLSIEETMSDSFSPMDQWFIQLISWITKWVRKKDMLGLCLRATLDRSITRSLFFTNDHTFSISTITELRIRP